MTPEEFGQLLASVTGKSPAEVLASLKTEANGDEYKDTAGQIAAAKELLVGKIQTVSAEQKARGTREALSGLERELKQEFGFAGDAKGKELVTAIVAKAKADAATEAGGASSLADATPEELAALPQVQQMITTKLQEGGQKYTELQEEFNQFKQNQERTALKTVAEKRAIAALEKHKAILGEGDDKTKRLNFFLKSLPYDSFKLHEENGEQKVIVLDENGHTMQDNFGNPIPFEQFIKEQNPYGFHKFDPQQGSPNHGQGGGNAGGGGGSSLNFKSDAEYHDFLANPNVKIEDKRAAMTARQQQQK